MDALVESLSMVLASALSPDLSVRREAETFLENAEKQSFSDYLRALSAILRSEGSDESIRHIGGICFKNAIKGVAGGVIDKSKRDRYCQLDPALRAELKESSLQALKLALGTSLLSNTIAQVLSSVARVELTVSPWPELVPFLNTLYTEAPASALRTMGYLMEDVFDLQEEEPQYEDPGLFTPNDINLLLTSLVDGCKHTDSDVRVSALSGFYHALNLCEENMKVAEQRTAIMMAIMTNLAQTQPIKVQQAAWDACVGLCYGYYELLSTYIIEMFPLSLSAIAGEENLALSAVEFWSTICDMELHLEEEGKVDEHQAYIDQAKQYLIPLLLQKLTKDEDEDEEGWTLSMASSTCLDLIAQVLGDKLFDVKTPNTTQCFIIDVIMSMGDTNWRLAEASIMAFGNCLEGPSTEKLSPFINQSIQSLATAMESDNVIIRESTAWTLGRLAQFHAESLLPPLKEGLIQTILKHLRDDPRVAKYVCYTVYELAGYCSSQSTNGDNTAFAVIQPFYRELCAELITTAKREDKSSEARGLPIGAAAYEALSKVICAAPANISTQTDFGAIVLEISEELCRTLETSLQIELNDDVQQIQGHVCGCLSMAIRKMDHITNRTFFDGLIHLLTQVTLQYRKQQEAAIGRGGSADEVVVSEECNEAIDCLNGLLQNHSDSGALMINQEQLKTLQDIIVDGMVPSQNPSYVKAVVGLSRQFCSFLMTRMQSSQAMGAISPQINQLFKLLASAETDQMMKPDVINVLGDIAMTCGNPFFLEHVQDTLSYLEQAIIALDQTQAQLGEITPEWRDYKENVRNAVLNCYSGIFYGLQSPMVADITPEKINADVLERSKSVPIILHFLAGLFQDSQLGDENTYLALGLVGDLLTAFKKELIQFMQTSQVGSDINVLAIIEMRFHGDTGGEYAKYLSWIKNQVQRYSI